MWFKAFWISAGELAIRGGAQMVLAAWVIGDGIANILEFDWQLGLGAFGGGVVLSILTSVAASGVNITGTTTFSKSELTS